MRWPRGDPEGDELSMTPWLRQLISKEIRHLEGAEFKVAVYLYGRFDSRMKVEIKIPELAKKVFLSERRTQAALQSLKEKKLLEVERNYRGMICRLPAKWAGVKRLRKKRSSLTAPATPSAPDEAQAPPGTNRPEADKPSVDKADLVRRLAHSLLERPYPIRATDWTELYRCVAMDSNLLIRRLQHLQKSGKKVRIFSEICTKVRALRNVSETVQSTEAKQVKTPSVAVAPAPPPTSLRLPANTPSRTGG